MSDLRGLLDRMHPPLLEDLHELVEEQPNCIQECEWHRGTALHLAMYRQHPFEIFRFLVEKWPAGVMVVDPRTGALPVSLACGIHAE